jgi:hypothetical protein
LPKKPTGTPSELAAATKALHIALAMDSKSWFSNVLIKDSLENVIIEARQADGMVVRGVFHYLYVGSDESEGWVRGLYQNGVVTCLQYWDTSACDPVRKATLTADELLRSPQPYSARKAQENAKQTADFNVAARKAIARGDDPNKCVETSGITRRTSYPDRTDGSISYAYDYIGVSVVNGCDYAVEFKDTYYSNEHILLPGGSEDVKSDEAGVGNHLTDVRIHIIK